MTAWVTFKRPIILGLLGIVVGLGFLATTLSSYYTSRTALRENIINTELPLVSNAVYGEVRNDLVRPVQVARALSSDVFLHDWISRGEQDPRLVSRFLSDIRAQNHTTSAFSYRNAPRRITTKTACSNRWTRATRLRHGSISFVTVGGHGRSSLILIARPCSSIAA